MTDTLRDPPDPIPMRLVCEGCGKLHIDEGEFATKSHHTHSCQHCGLTWRPAVVPTVGVQFLPGFRNDPLTTGEDFRSDFFAGMKRYASSCEPIHVGSTWVSVSGVALEVTVIGLTTGPYPIQTVSTAGTHSSYQKAAFRMLFLKKSDVAPIPTEHGVMSLMGTQRGEGTTSEGLGSQATPSASTDRKKTEPLLWKKGDWAQVNPGAPAIGKVVQVREVRTRTLDDSPWGDGTWVSLEGSDIFLRPEQLKPWVPKIGDWVRASSGCILRVKLPAQDRAEGHLLCTALEGGDSYWHLDKLEPWRPKTNGKEHVRFTDGDRVKCGTVDSHMSGSYLIHLDDGGQILRNLEEIVPTLLEAPVCPT